jgi:hypothetical protein
MMIDVGTTWAVFPVAVDTGLLRAGLVAGALFMRTRPAVEAFWIVSKATSPLMVLAIELSR